jgi:molybdenum cofactor cytidylyltransferase
VIYTLCAIAQAQGAVLVHSLKIGGQSFPKGHVLNAADLAALAPFAATQIAVLRLEPGDVPENEAASRIARGLLGAGLSLRPAFTGRANLHADASGLVLIDQAAINAVNAIDEGLTIATVPAFARVRAGQMVATVKIIPYALRAPVVEDGEARIAQSLAPLALAPFLPKRTALILTQLSGEKPGLAAKTRAVTENRLADLGVKPVLLREISHEKAAIADALAEAKRVQAELVLIAGAAATVDRHDTVPSAILAAGGAVLHFGMPVDPGNLLLLARIGETPVLGLPGCARSPKLNGVDWVLERLMAGLTVMPQDIQSMGVGGLLMDTPLRPQRREATRPSPPRVGAVLLAAGLSRRMGTNKLLAPLAGKPMVRHVAEALCEAGLSPIRVVLGHEAERVRAALSDLDVVFSLNETYEQGLASSLACGIISLEADGVDAALVALGDMPLVTPLQLRRLIAAFAGVEGPAIGVPTYEGKQGNPVIWSRFFFPELKGLSGDRGAKALIGLHDEHVVAVEMENAAVLSDADTPAALAALSEHGRKP